jgi:hypothetical protein
MARFAGRLVVREEAHAALVLGGRPSAARAWLRFSGVMRASVIDATGRVTVRYVRREAVPTRYPLTTAPEAPARWSVRRRVAVATAVLVPPIVVGVVVLWRVWVHLAVILGQVGARPGLQCPGCKCR